MILKKNNRRVREENAKSAENKFHYFFVGNPLRALRLLCALCV